MEITSRDAALLTWTGAFILWSLSRPGMGRLVVGLLRSAAAPKLVGLGIVFTLYAAAEVVLLHRLGFWHAGLAKVTLLWYVFTCITSGFRSLSSDADLIKASRNGLSIAVAAEVLFNTVTFSYPVEFVIVGIGSALGLVSAVTSARDQDSHVHQLMRRVVGIFGLAVAAAVFVRAFSRTPEVNFFLLLSELLVPIVLSILFIPAAKAAGAYARYEWLAGHLRQLRSGSLRSRIALFAYLGVDQDRVLKFGRNQMWLLREASTYEDVRGIISTDRMAA